MNLPSIHTLLNPPPSPPSCHNNNNNNSNHSQPPTVQILPASPIPTSTMENVTLSPILSPALSSTRSPSVSSVDPISPMAMNSYEFPPIHGDDPPRRLVHSPSPSLQPKSPTHYLHHSHYHASSYHNHHRLSSSHSEPASPSYGFNNTKDHITSTSCYGANTLPTPPTTYHPTPSAPPIVVSRPSSPSSCSTTTTGVSQDFLSPNQASRTDIHTNGLSSPSPSTSPLLSPSPSPSPKESVPPPPPCTQILISPTGQPILKRRRGRPPTRSPGYDEGGWTFLSPTVWDVASSSSQQQQQHQHKEHQKEAQHGKMIDNDSTITESMTAFTGADMDTVLPMPKKKRGRKPKTHIEGNSCFIWKDLGATTRKSTTS